MWEFVKGTLEERKKTVFTKKTHIGFESTRFALKVFPIKFRGRMMERGEGEKEETDPREKQTFR